MELLKLAAVFAVIIVLLFFFKKSLSVAMAAGCAALAVLFLIPPLTAGEVMLRGVLSQNTLTIVASYYIISFLQHMMDERGHLMLAHRALSGLLNNRRVNASLAPLCVGFLPTPGAVVIAGAMVESACGDKLSREDQTFVTSWFRHVPESFLPTYSSVLIACKMANVQPGDFVLGMLPMVAALIAIGYLFYLRRLPRDTGLPKSENRLRDARSLVVALWPVVGITVLIIALKAEVYVASLLVIALYYLLNRFKFDEIRPFFRSSFEARIIFSTCWIMVFRELIAHTGVVEQLPALLSGLPIPDYLVFAVLFLLGTLVAGSTAIMAIGLPLAFAAIPSGGMPLLVFLATVAFAGMQVSPTHICLFLACEYYKTEMPALIKRTLPVLGVFLVVLTGYYLLLRTVAGA